MPVRLPRRAFRFGGFELDVSAFELRQHGRRIRIERRPMELLMLLVDRRGELVTRDEIVERLWDRDVFIDIDTSLNTVIRKVRRALRDSADCPRFIQTVQGKGYRFVAEVESASGTALAVLPFENLQGGADDDYVAEGLTEETIVGLGQIDPERVSVIGRTSSMAYRGTAKKLDEIGRELGVDYLVEGSVRTASGRCRITARLVRARDQVQVWTETYERESNDLLGLQADLGGAIARQIELLLSPQRAFTIIPRQTHDPEAYDLYLRGRYYRVHPGPERARRRGPGCVDNAGAIIRQRYVPPYAIALAFAGLIDEEGVFEWLSNVRPGARTDVTVDSACCRSGGGASGSRWARSGLHPGHGTRLGGSGTWLRRQSRVYSPPHQAQGLALASPLLRLRSRFFCSRALRRVEPCRLLSSVSDSNSRRPASAFA